MASKSSEEITKELFELLSSNSPGKKSALIDDLLAKERLAHSKEVKQRALNILQESKSQKEAIRKIDLPVSAPVSAPEKDLIKLIEDKLAQVNTRVEQSLLQASKSAVLANFPTGAIASALDATVGDFSSKKKKGRGRGKAKPAPPINIDIRNVVKAEAEIVNLKKKQKRITKVLKKVVKERKKKK